MRARYLARQPAAGRSGTGLHPTAGLHDPGHVPARGRRCARRQAESTLLTAADFEAGIAPCRDWFDLDHPTQPFMQTRGVVSKEATPIQKLLIGLPDGNNHCFFNDTGRSPHSAAPVAAIALFHQASNCPSFGGGFKGSLRGGAPITTWWTGRICANRSGATSSPRSSSARILPNWQHDLTRDRPTWIDPIKAGQTIQPLTQIGLARGLFWQPAHVELISVRRDPAPATCWGSRPARATPGSARRSSTSP